MALPAYEKEMEEGKTYYRNNNWSNREMGKKSSEKTVKNKWSELEDMNGVPKKEYVRDGINVQKIIQQKERVLMRWWRCLIGRFRCGNELKVMRKVMEEGNKKESSEKDNQGRDFCCWQ